MYYIILLIFLIALLAILVALRHKQSTKSNNKQSSTQTQNQTVVTTLSEEVDVITEEYLFELAKNSSERDFVFYLKSLILEHFKGTLEMDKIVKFLELRNEFLSNDFQLAKTKQSATGACLATALNRVYGFLKDEYSKTLQIFLWTTKSKKKKLRADLGKIKSFMQAIEDNRGVLMIHIFFPIPKDPADKLEKPFQECYMSVFPSEETELVKLLKVINFNFDKFDMLMSAVATQELAHVDATGILEEAKNRREALINMLKADVELQAVLPKDFQEKVMGL